MGRRDRDRGVEPGRARSQRHQRIHVGRAPPRGGPGPGEETAPRVEKDRQSQQPGKPPGRHARVLGQARQSRNHLPVPDQHHGKPARHPHAEAPHQRGPLRRPFFVALPGSVQDGLRPGQHLGPVAGLLDRAHQRSRVRGPPREPHPRDLFDQAYAGLAHTLRRTQRLLDGPHARGAVHAPYAQLDLTRPLSRRSRLSLADRPGSVVHARPRPRTISPSSHSSMRTSPEIALALRSWSSRRSPRTASASSARVQRLACATMRRARKR